MTQEDKILLTARYVEGDMDSSEEHEYELRLEHEPDLIEHLRDYLEINDNFLLDLSLGARQQSFFQQPIETKKHYRVEEPDVLPIVSILKWFVAIAVFMVSIFLIWAPWNVNLYRTYANYQKIPMQKIYDGDSTKMRNAIYLYNDGHYLLASQMLASQYVKSPTNAALSYAYANTLIETNHLEDARSILRGVLARNSDYKYFAEFSLGLSYVREEDNRNAKIWLQKIPRNSQIYSVAQELYKQL